jgi:O-antigen/teichoic acid export membrane protein
MAQFGSAASVSSPLAELDLAADGEGSPALPRAAPIAGIGRTLGFGIGAHFLVALVNVLATPLLLKLMGEEAYGLVTFFLVLQAWSLIFDFGVSPTLARQLSRFRAGAMVPAEASGLLAAAEIIFIAGGLTGGAALALMSSWLSIHWLHSATLGQAQVAESLRLIAVVLVFRWLNGLYQSALVGLERQNTVNLVAASTVVIRYGVALAVLFRLSHSPIAFFAVQAIFTALEAGLSRWLLARALPRPPAGVRPAWRRLTREFRFALGLTLASAATTLISQADRLALSHALPLADYGLFGLVMQVAAGITLVVPPFVQAFQPRLTGLMAQERRKDFVQVYRLALALILSLAVGVAGTIAAHPDWVIWAWTGRVGVAAYLAPILTLYAAGGAISAFLYVPFLLQYAQGRVRLHVIGNIAFALVWVPAAVWAAFAYGPMGTGVVWLTGNALYLTIWVPVIHRTLLSADERRGLDVGIWLRAAVLAGLLAATRLIPFGHLSRPEAFSGLAVICIATILIGAAMSSEARAFAAHTFARLRGREP